MRIGRRAAGQVSGTVPKSKAEEAQVVVWSFFALLARFILAGGTFWYINNFGYETTDDAAIEGHVIQVSPKLSAHVKAVHFDDNYQVTKGDLLIELDPRDYRSQLSLAP